MTSLLSFDHVALRRGGRLLFEDLSFSLGPGEQLHVAGPNGSGKSSLIRLAAGLLEPEAGHVERARVALADDSIALDRELPLARALRFWCDKADDALETLGLYHVSRVPVRLLSSGQLKRATLARVIASGARLWLLDEPLNALDIDGARRLSEAIARHLDNGGAVVATSHQALDGEWRRLELKA